jgi:hypothetical protein
MDFEEKLGDLVDEALGQGGVSVEDVIECLRHHLQAVRLLKAEGDRAPGDTVFGDFSMVERDEG